MFVYGLLRIKKAGRGKIDGPLPTASNVVHACFSEHVMNGFYTHDISERSEAIPCFENCTGEPSTLLLGPGNSSATPLFVPDLEDDNFEVCPSHVFEISPHCLLPAACQPINVHQPDRVGVIGLSEDPFYTFGLPLFPQFWYAATHHTCIWPSDYKCLDFWIRIDWFSWAETSSPHSTSLPKSNDASFANHSHNPT